MSRHARARLHASVTALRVTSPAMATLHPHALNERALNGRAVDETARNDARVRRLCVIALAAAVLLAAYAGGVAWVTRLAEAGVDRSLQPLPALVRDRPAP